MAVVGIDLGKQSLKAVVVGRHGATLGAGRARRFFGLTAFHDKASWARALFEGCSFAMRDVVDRLDAMGIAAQRIRLSGGAAIDFCEDVLALPRSEVLKIVRIFVRFGATAKFSSIHVNGWFGSYDKLSTSRAFLRDCFGVDIDSGRDRIAFAGDSPNDAPMFSFFPNSIGVANVLDFGEELPASPAYVANGRGPDGFAELADLLIAAKG